MGVITSKFDTIRGILQVISRYWAYNCATFFCVCIIILTCIAFGMPWYRDHYDGNFYFPTDNSSSSGTYTTWSITEYYFHLEVNLFDQDISCNYADGVCDLGDIVGPALPGLQHWDLKYYQQTYAASFTFALIAVFLSIALIPMLQIQQWKPTIFPPKIRIAFFWVTFAVCLALFGSLLIDWTVHMGHPRMVGQSIGYPADYCDRWSNNNHWRAGTLCSWYGHRDISAKDNPALIPFLYVKANNYYAYWNPRTGWQMTTMSLGASLWVLIMVVGWRPNFEE